MARFLLTILLTACGGGESVDFRSSCLPRDLSAPQVLYDCKGSEISDFDVNSDEVGWVVLNSTTHASYNGVGRFGNCTGTLIEPKVTSATTPAYVLTNGHCLGDLLDPSGVFYDVETSKTMTFQYFLDLSQSSRLVFSSKIARVASMDNTDLALVELEATLSEVKAQGIASYSIASYAPTEGRAIKLIGVPLSGVSSSLIGLRGSSCVVGANVSLREGDYSFGNSYRVRCSIVGGNSGSPIFDKSTGEIVMLANTTVTDASSSKSSCALDRPCEVSAGGTVVNEKDNYGQATYILSGCFDSNGFFDKSQATCVIAK
ncbi:MAG: trypsin-like peptidase domain-containing protein [Deltaproteobacteria bacterium]|nr:trypsin-like peptidase domain-containing protein [Deltaproteobacteria bacterium]